MVGRVATYFQNQNNLRNLQNTNSALELTTYQILTGDKAKRLADLGSDVSQILTLRDVQQRTSVYAGNVTSANNLLKASESALQDMTDLLAQASALATQGRNENSAETRASLAPKAQALTEAFYAAYKTQYNGTYLFSGMNGAEAPTAAAATATAYPGDPLPTTWYDGDTQLPHAMTGPGTTMEYGVPGNDEAFVKMKAALEALWHGLETNSTTDMDQAVTALQEAKTGLSTLLGRVGGQMNGLEEISNRQTQQTTFTKEQLDGLEKVDVAEALTRYSQQQATLQASMMILTQSSQLTLLDYLR